ncbi:MAG: glycoside hydrolase family 16 protein [Bryobacteraceae bacterium]
MNPLLLLLISSLLLAQKPARQPQTADSNTDWILTFADEFSGSELDLARWAPHDPWGQARDRQLQAWAPDSIAISAGELHLIATRTTESRPVRYDGKEREYASGIVTTLGTFAQLYGRFEIRCKVPAGKGLRSALSLFPLPLGPLPRIDIFEVSGNTPSAIFFANHWGTEQTERSFGDSFPGPDLSTAFHTIAIEWDADKIAWFLDGKETFRSVDGIPHQSMFLLLDLAVGGGTGSILTRTPDESTRFPASFDIDYVRVYKRR